MKLLSLILFALLLYTGCKKPEKQVGHNELIELDSSNLLSVEINSPTDRSKQIYLENIFDSIHFVPLETNSDILLDGNIKDIRICKDHFVILDRKELYVFDQQGKFCNKIGRQGKGPEEYQEIRNFYVNDNSEVVILDLSLEKFLFYSLGGEFQRMIGIQNVLNTDVKGKKIQSGFMKFLFPMTVCYFVVII